MKQTNRAWRVEYEGLAYDGGGYSSWTQYYRTKLGAKFSAFLHLHIRSWGGAAKLINNKKEK